MLSIDVMLLVGGKGGFENALNRTANYLSGHNCHIRFVQIKKTGFKWYTDLADFVCFDTGDNINIEDCTKKYIDLLKSTYIPNLVMIAGFPHIIAIAKNALYQLGIKSCPTICWPHNNLSFYDSSLPTTLSYINMAEYIFAISDEIAKDISDNLPGKIIYRINNTIDLGKIVYSTDRNSNILTFVGRLSPEKNIGLIIKAISLSKSSWNLQIIGEGPEEENLRKLSASLNLDDNISFLGWVDNPWEKAKNSRALILSSFATEGSPLTCIEALFCGMPVISTPVATLPEIITPGFNGYLFPINDEKALAAILDDIALKPFTVTDSENCLASAAEFRPEIALWDFLCKAAASAKLVGLPQRHWEVKEKRLVSYKASALIADIKKDDELFTKQLDSLAGQTIEPVYYEIIIVHAKERSPLASFLHEYEARYSDKVLLIECDSISSDEEAYEIARSYASGEMIFSFEKIHEVPTEGFIEELYMKRLCSEE